ncbi:MAG: hypothetical protein NUV96_02690 [Candidatus Colwellbacteria bacterium]|nr:hypothetical protein [Candidatus Colwellbacteria bacterium]
MEDKKTKDRLLLIDANSLIHRAYHAIPPLTGPKGQPTGALYGLASVLIKLFKEDTPRYAVAAFDRKEPTFRKKQYDAYKGTRPPTPDNLIEQLKEAPKLLRCFGVYPIDAIGYEADDLIATLATKFASEQVEVEIMSGDLDILQVVEDGRIFAKIPKKGITETAIYKEHEVKERFGVSPSLLADYKGLAGDASDNIPGVSGLGPKSTATLINEFGTIEKIYESLEKIKKDKPTIGEKLEAGKGSAFMSKTLATLIKNVPSPDSLNAFEVGNPLKSGEVLRCLEDLGFKTLVKRVEEAKQEANRLF